MQDEANLGSTRSPWIYVSIVVLARICGVGDPGPMIRPMLADPKANTPRLPALIQVQIEILLQNTPKGYSINKLTMDQDTP
ncbi:hypothetical protein [Okeania sp. SIO2B3]|uniref:hypothetical protein n=1 Tax=Okeania sp. SIO2B3 TaxID=2607784 RepID=UPI0013C10293|nr:hypothetical protein [Okeania sp. SIO2B3]NET46352.1 hypothetical protein [Okeania sp. SIO2B3]